MSDSRVHIIFLHGFNSSPCAPKCAMFAEYMAELDRFDHFHAPNLHCPPNEVVAKLEQLIAQINSPHITLVGSSMGGYFAAHFAHKYDLKAALINPALKPYEALAAYLGNNENPYTGAILTLKPEHGPQLQALEIAQVTTPEHYLLLLQTGDDVIDYRQALQKFPDSPRILQQGGSHAFDDFDRQIPTIMRFAEGESLREIMP